MLLRDAQVQVGDDDLAGLHRRTEGWAAGLYLAALSVREGGSLPGAAARRRRHPEDPPHNHSAGA